MEPVVRAVLVDDRSQRLLGLLVQPGLGEPRLQVDDIDAERSNLRPQGRRIAVHRVFRTNVGCSGGKRDVGQDARYVDNRAATPLAHVRENGPDEAVGAEHVDVELGPEVVCRDFLDGPGLGDPSVVDQTVDVTVLVDNAADDTRTVRLVRDVEFGRLASPLTEILDVGWVPGGGVHRPSPIEKRQGTRPPDTGRTPGEQHRPFHGPR